MHAPPSTDILSYLSATYRQLWKFGPGRRQILRFFHGQASQEVQRREFCSIFCPAGECTQADRRGGAVSIDIVFPMLAIIQCKTGSTSGEWSPPVLLLS